MMDANWDDFRFVLAVAQTGTLGRAADMLGVNQTTVSRRIRAMQDRLQVRLFDQTRDGAVLTAAGHDVVRLAQEIADRVQQIDTTVVGQDAALSGCVRITAMDYLFTAFADPLRTFRDRYPGVTLDAQVSYSTLNLIQREADVAFRVSAAPPESLVGRNFGRVGFGVYGAKHRYPSPSEVNLEAEPWISWPSHLEPIRQMEQWMLERFPEVSVKIRADSIFVILRWVAQGLGVAILPCILADLHADVVHLADATAAFDMDLWLLTHPDLKNTARIRAFLDHLSEAIEPRMQAVRGPEGAGREV